MFNINVIFFLVLLGLALAGVVHYLGQSRFDLLFKVLLGILGLALISGIFATINKYNNLLVFSIYLAIPFFIPLVYIVHLGFNASLEEALTLLKVPPKEPTPEIVEEPTRLVFPEIPKAVRLEHMLILGSSGSGKTQLIETLLAQDIFTPSSVIVFDSQGDLLQEILKVDIPKDRIVYLDPTDVENPIALSFFDFKTSGLTPYEREKNFNSVVELLLFVLNSLDSGVTAKQELCLRMLIRFCLVIPNATIHTLRELLSEQGFKRYTVHLNKVSETAQHFFKDDYLSKSFGETREQISRRVYTILESPLERILSSPKSRVNMRELLDNGSIVLVNTAKSFLKEQGSAFFARFITALIFQAIQERDPRKQNLDVFMYIDEAAPIISEQITSILETSRKYRLGVTLAFQSLSQIPTEFAQSIITNTSVKAVSGISAKDSRALADDMKTRPEVLLSMQKLQFFLYVKGSVSNAYHVPINELQYSPQRSDLAAVLKHNRNRFCRQEEKKIIATPDDDINTFNKS